MAAVNCLRYGVRAIRRISKDREHHLMSFFMAYAAGRIHFARSEGVWGLAQDAWASRKYVECASTDFHCNMQNDGVIDQPPLEIDLFIQGGAVYALL